MYRTRIRSRIRRKTVEMLLKTSSKVRINKTAKSTARMSRKMIIKSENPLKVTDLLF